VYNGHPHVHNYGDSVTIGMEELWDRLLVHYLREGRSLLYGLATDDSHNYLEYKTGMSNPGRGWLMVRARDLSPGALIEAMESGNFYATTGVELKDVRFAGRKLAVEVKPAPGVSYTIEFWGAKNDKTPVASARKKLKVIQGTHASYKLGKDDLYVRARIISSKRQQNPYQAGDVETAWTQPVQGN
jgi:hypothetical protein